MCKVRYGFVSNSSSSSFILPVNNSDTFEIKIPIDQLVDIINNSDGEGDALIIYDIDCLETYIRDIYGWAGKSIEEILEDESAIDTYTHIKSFLDEGKSVVVGSVAYHDEIVTEIIQRNGGSIGDY